MSQHPSPAPAVPASPDLPGPDLPAALLWDMDGTLVDTEPYWIAAEFALVAEHGGTWSMEQAHSLVGQDLRESARRLRTEGGVDLPIDDVVERLLARVAGMVREQTPWRPGARELLAAAVEAGVPCALVTMSWAVLAQEVVTALPQGTFATVVTGDAVTRPKPHPEPYLEAARRLGVDPGACVALEDSTAGVTSALAAGVATVGVPCVVELEPRERLVRVAGLQGRDLGWLARVAAGLAEDEDEGAGRPVQG